MKHLPKFLLIPVFAVFLPALKADVTLPAIISDHMVLQKTAKVPIWGKADPGEEVSVSLPGAKATAKAGDDGKWKLVLNLKDSAPGPFEMTVQGKNLLKISDVVVGEVWVASGQSNMEFELRKTIDADKEIAESANPMLRQFTVKKSVSPSPLDDTEGQWLAASPETSGSFTAVGYFFARKIQNELRVPVGIVHTSWGGTPSEAWTSPEALKTVPELSEASNRLWADFAAYPEAKASYLKTMAAWVSANAREDKPSNDVTAFAGAEVSFPELSPRQLAAAPVPTKTAATPQHTASFLFNGMINPIVPYAIRGVIWYQGEANAGRALQYHTAFPLLISDWRKVWQQGDFPFYFCQLANYMPKKTDPGESAWAELREAQNQTLQLPHTGQAVLIDIGESGDIHPRNKKVAGERLARLALANDYGKSLPDSGPVLKSVKIEGDKIRLSFDKAEEGLTAAPLAPTFTVISKTGETAPLVRNSPDSPLEGFAICGEDRKWVWADAKIDGDSVIVWSEKIPAPVAVRYAWSDNPTCNLTNTAGLPASPFRTDDFPLTTANARY